jgi:hypothetical protein
MSLQSVQEIVESYLPDQPETVYSIKYQMEILNPVNAFKTDEETDIELQKLGYIVNRVIVDSPVGCGNQIILILISLTHEHLHRLF